MTRQIGVLTGNANVPGMNAAIYGVTKTAFDHNWKVLGICNGFAGLLHGAFIPLTPASVEDIVQEGGNLLGSTPSAQFMTEAGQIMALGELGEHAVDELIVIGGDGSLQAAYELSQMKFPVNCVACTVENDVPGSDVAIGFDTAINIGLKFLEPLKKVPPQDKSLFLVQVAGQKYGCGAFMTGVESGAALVVTPETCASPDDIVHLIRDLSHKESVHTLLVVVAEGATCNMSTLINHFVDNPIESFKLCAVSLSDIQHNATPSAFDRLLGVQLGTSAVTALAHGECGVLAGIHNSRVQTIPLAIAITQPRTFVLDVFHVPKAVNVPLSDQ